MEQLIDLLLGYIVSDEKIYKEIQETISGDSSGITCDEIFLKYYETIPSEEMSLIYACLAKILNYKEYNLSKEIEEIAKTWGEIKVGSESFHVPYVINEDDFDDEIKKYTTVKFSGELYKCLNLIAYPEKEEEIKKYKDTTKYEHKKIKSLVKKIAGKIDQPALEPYMHMARTEIGKTYCEIPRQIATKIYEAWKKLYNLEDDKFKNLFPEFDSKDKKISIFFKACRIGVDCSGYVNQVYGQWMLNNGKSQKEMAETIGPNRDNLENEINDNDICRDGCGLIREEKIEIKKNNKVVKVVNFSLHHIGYFFHIKEINKNTESIKIWNRSSSNKYTETKATIDMNTVNETVKSKLKAGDLICFANNGKGGAHYAIVEKTGINEKGQWYFCITESTTKEKIEWMKDPETGKIIKNKDPWDGVRHDQGHYISIEDFKELRDSRYDFFWFCRPKAINEYYNSI